MPTKQEILSAIVTEYFDDLEFIENVNNITWARKAQLKSNLPNHQKHDKMEQK